MNETSDIMELLKICAMNTGTIAQFLSDAQCNTFEELIVNVLIYEELAKILTSTKNEGISSNAMSLIT